MLRRATSTTDAASPAPLGHFFTVMTNGYGAMPDYAAQMSPADRWAIVAYIKALAVEPEGANGRMSLRGPR